MAPLIRMHAEIEAPIERIAVLLRLDSEGEAQPIAGPELRRVLG